MIVSDLLVLSDTTDSRWPRYKENKNLLIISHVFSGDNTSDPFQVFHEVFSQSAVVQVVSAVLGYPLERIAKGFTWLHDCSWSMKPLH